MNEFAAFRETQDSIYARITAAHMQLGKTATLQNGVTEPQGAYLVAYRHSDAVVAHAEHISGRVADLTPAITYGRNNLHSTLTDHGLTANLVINPGDNLDHEETIEALVKAVRAGLDKVGVHAMGDSFISYRPAISDGKAVIAPGQPSDTLLGITFAVKQASVDQGFDGGKGIKGSWGAHSTLNRFTADSSLETAAQVAQLIDSEPSIGRSLPVAIDVGYFAVSQAGFDFTTYERFPLTRS